MDEPSECEVEDCEDYVGDSEVRVPDLKAVDKPEEAGEVTGEKHLLSASLRFASFEVFENAGEGVDTLHQGEESAEGQR